MIERALRRWTSWSFRYGPWVIVAMLLATALIAFYTAKNLAMQTDTTEMLSGELEWRKINSQFDRALPDLQGNIVIVVTGKTPDLARDGADALASRLVKTDDVFKFVFHPPGDPFFKTNGLLFQSTEELDDLSSRLADAQPLLAALRRDPNLRGLFEVLADATDEIAAGKADGRGLARVFDLMAAAIDDTLSGGTGRLSWSALFEGRDAKPSDRRQIIIVHPTPDYKSLSPARRSIDSIRAAVSALALDEAHGYSVKLTGGLFIQEEELNSVQKTAGLAGLISLLLVGTAIFFGLRSGRLVFATLAVLLVGLIWTAGFATLAIGHLNVISVAFAVLFLGLSVDYGIQYGLRYREALDRGAENDKALGEAGVGVGRAVCLSGVTSAIGFFAFVPTHYVGMAELGIIAGTGIFIAIFLYLTLLPAILSVFPLQRRTGALPERVITRIGGRLTTWPRAVVAVSLVLVFGGLFLTPGLRFEFDPIKLKDPNSESVRTFLNLAADSDTSPYVIGILAPDGKTARDLAGRLEKLPEVDHVTTPASFTPADQDDKLEIIAGMALFLSPVFMAPDAAPPVSDGERRLAMARLRASLRTLASLREAGPLAMPAQRLARSLDGAAMSDPSDTKLPAIERALLEGLPARIAELETALAAGRVTDADLPELLRRRIYASDGSHLVSVYPRHDLSDRAALRRFVEAVSDVAPRATDLPVVILRAGDSVVQAFLEAGAFAGLGIILVLVVVLRKLADVALVLAPVILALVLSLAATVLFDVPFNFANVIALPLLLALGVDFGIHLVLRYRESGENLANLIASSTPRAIFYSGLTTMCSFGSLIVSDHLGTASMGWLLLISITLALVCALIVVPALIGWKESRKEFLEAPSE